MNAIQPEKIQKKSFKRRLVRHINTGLFWCYGLFTGLLAFQCCKFFQQNSTTSILIGIGLGLIAAFTLTPTIHPLLWKKFQSEWPNRILLMLLLLGYLLVNYATNVRIGRIDAGWELTRSLIILLIIIANGYNERRNRNPPPLSLVLKLADYRVIFH